MAVSRHMWACIRNIYLRLLGNRRSSTRLIQAPSSCHHIIRSIHASRLTGYIQHFYTLELFHELLSDIAGETRTNSVIHPCIERRMPSQVSQPPILVKNFNKSITLFSSRVIYLATMNNTTNEDKFCNNMVPSHGIILIFSTILFVISIISGIGTALYRRLISGMTFNSFWLKLFSYFIYSVNQPTFVYCPTSCLLSKGQA